MPPAGPESRTTAIAPNTFESVTLEGTVGFADYVVSSSSAGHCGQPGRGREPQSLPCRSKVL